MYLRVVDSRNSQNKHVNYNTRKQLSLRFSFLFLLNPSIYTHPNMDAVQMERNNISENKQRVDHQTRLEAYEIQPLNSF